MVKIRYENPFEEMEKIIQIRRVLAARVDQLDMLTKEGRFEAGEPLSLIVTDTGLIFKSTHRGIIKKVLAFMLSEYRKRLFAIEREIKELSQKIIEYNGST